MNKFEYTQYNDEELVRLILDKNDAEAMQTLLFRYEPEVKKIVNFRLAKTMLRNYDREEFYQQVRLTTIQILDRFDPLKGDFYTFWTCAASRTISSEIRSIMSKGRQQEIGQSYFFNEEVGEDFFENMSGNELLLTDQISIDEMMKKICEIRDNFFTETEKQVLAYRLAGYSYVEIAKQIKSTPKGVDNTMLMIRKKLKKYL